MKQPRRRATYQYGTLTIETRSRGPNVWAYRYFERANGKKLRRKAIIGTLEQFPTRAAAERASEHVRLAANAETHGNECPTIQGLVGRYIEQVLRPCLDLRLGDAQDDGARMGYQTARSYQSVLERWILPRWADYSLREFSTPVARTAVEEWLHGLRCSPHNPVGLAPKTVRAIFTVMKLAFKFGVKWGYLHENPMAEKRVELPRGSTKRVKEPVQLTPAEFFLLLARLPLREQVAVAFAGWLGPRISEAFGLQWRDLDLAQGVVSFRRGFVQGRITPLKTEASRTNLPLPEELQTLLVSWRLATLYNRPEDWLFASPYTKGQRPYWPGQLFKTHTE